MKNRIWYFSIIMILLLAASQYFLGGATNINYMPVILLIYATLIITFRQSKDVILNISIAYALSHFHFAVKAGMLGPWVILTYIVISRGALFKHKVNANIMVQAFIFFLLNLLGLVTKNPNTLIEKTASAVSLIGLMSTLILVSGCIIDKDDIKFIIQVFGIMTLYTCLSSINTALRLIVLDTPLLITSMEYFALEYAAPMFGRSYAEYFLCMSVFFFVLIASKSDVLLKLKRKSLILFYLAAILGTLLGYSKTMTVLLIVSHIMILMKTSISMRFLTLMRLLLLLLGASAMILLVQKFINLAFIFDRFSMQPEIFTNIINNPLTAELTSREDSFYWGWYRNTNYSWLLGYGWSPADANNAAYFHNVPINYAKHDFHNLYLSLFPVFGWFGGSIFLLWVFQMVLKSYRLSRAKHDSATNIIGSSFFVLSIVFVFGEYAIPITSEANYFFIFIVWMGFVNALYNQRRLASITNI